MGDHPNLSTASMSAPAVISGLIGSKSTTTSSRNAEARTSSKKIGREPAGPVRNHRTKLVSEIGSEPATLTSTIAASTNHKMAAGATERIHHNAPLPRRTGKSKPKNPDPFLCYTKPSRRVLDHIRQLAAKIKDFEVPESGGLQVELMELVIAEFPETASDPNVKEDERLEALVNQHDQRVTAKTNPPSQQPVSEALVNQQNQSVTVAAHLPLQPTPKIRRRKSAAPRRTLGNAFV